MHYEKLTLERFNERLRNGKYAGLTGARRAIGKLTDWNKVERAAALAAAVKHFNAGGASAQGSRSSTRRTKATGKTPASTALAVSKEATPPRRGGRPLGSRNVPKTPVVTATSDIRVSTQAEILETIDMLRQGLMALRDLAALDPSMLPTAQAAGREFKEALSKLNLTIGLLPSRQLTRGGHLVAADAMEPNQFVDLSAASG